MSVSITAVTAVFSSKFIRAAHHAPSPQTFQPSVEGPSLKLSTPPVRDGWLAFREIYRTDGALDTEFKFGSQTAGLELRLEVGSCGGEREMRILR